MPDEVGLGAACSAPRRGVRHRSCCRETGPQRRAPSVGLHLDLVVLGDRIGEQPVAHQARPRLGLVA